MRRNQISKEVSNLSEEEAKDMLERLVETGYTLVQWPDSQALMSRTWFRKEAILDVDAIHGSSAYLVPTFRIM